MEYKLDLTGYNCPIPVLRTKKFLAELPAGALLDIISTDPASRLDLKDFCEKTGHNMVQQVITNGVITTTIRKKAASTEHD